MSDPASYDNCPASTCYVYLQRWNGSSWSTVQSTSTTIASPNYSFTFNPLNGQYRVYSTVNSYGTYCVGAASEYNEFANYTVNIPASATFRVNGNIMDMYDYLSICDAASITMDNISSAGTNSSYQWRVGAGRNGGTPVYTTWQTGTPPSSYNLKSLLQTIFSGQPLAADYDVYLETKNLCNSGSPYVYMGKLRVLASDLSILLQAKNTPSGTPLANIATNTTCAAPHTSLCSLSVIIAANQSTVPVLVGGTWRCTLQRSGLSNCLNMPTLVFSKPNATLTNLNDLASLDLNAFATTYGGHPIGYVTSNSATSIWRFTLTIANQCNPTGVTAIAWLRNLNSGCKTGEGDTETSIPDDAVTVDFDWTFYPNPSQDVVNVMWEGDYGKHKKADIRLFDMLGRMVMVPMEIADGAAMLDVSTLQKGNYVLLLHGSGLAPRMLTVK